MPPDTLTLKVVTPTEVFFEGPVTSVVAPAADGYLGILRGHAPLITSIDKGKLTFKDESGSPTSFKIEGGFLEILNNRVLVLTDSIEK